MHLNDSRMIEQAEKTVPREVEVLYWFVEDALHCGKVDYAKSILNLLLYIVKYSPAAFRSGMQLPYQSRLREITHELHGEGATKQIKSITMKPALNSSEIPFKLECELRDYLVKNKSILSKSLKDDLKTIAPEVVIDEEYRCDIVGESNDTLYAIELKIKQSNHAVVSQCSKYCYYFYRKMRYDRFKNIQGVVVSSGFDSWSINELRREGHLIYNVSSSDEKEKIKLTRIL